MAQKTKADKVPRAYSDMCADHWLFRLLPQKAAVYVQLARLDRPVGWQILFWTSVWGLLLGFYVQKMTWSNGGIEVLSRADFLPVALAHYYDFSPLGFFLFNAVLFCVGAVIMRGAGCVLNDIADYHIDSQVVRTASRPLPSLRVSRSDAALFMALLGFAGLVILLQLNRFAVMVGLCSLLPVAIYPFVKRVSDWPQAMLGIAFNWGVLVGFAAICKNLTWAAFLLYAAAFFWTIGFDTIYAHQDKDDDKLIGIGSTALLFGAQTRKALRVLYLLTIIFLIAAFFQADAGLWAFGGVFLAALCLLRQIKRFDADNPAVCLALFKNSVQIGWIIAVTAFVGLF